jgi:DNA-directed RNA polymerase subunit RPC12/RpoP
VEALLIQCTTCKARLRVTDPTLIGQIQECPKCGSMVLITPPPHGMIAGAQAPATPARAESGKSFESRDTVLEPPTETAPELPTPTTNTGPVIPPPLAPPKLPARKAVAVAIPLAVPTASVSTAKTPIPNASVATKPTAPLPKYKPLETHWLLAASGIMLVLVAVVLGTIVRSGEKVSPVKETESKPTPPTAPEKEAKETIEPVTPVEMTADVPNTEPPQTVATPVKPVVPTQIAVTNVDDIPPPALPSAIEPPPMNHDATAILDAALGSNTPASKDSVANNPEEKLPIAADEGANASRKAEIEKLLQERLTKVRYAKVELARFLEELGDLSGVAFRLDDKLPKGARVAMVSVRLDETTLATVLRTALEPLGLHYEVTKDRVLIQGK